MKINKDNRNTNEILNSLLTENDGINNREIKKLQNNSNIDNLFKNYDNLGIKQQLINYPNNSLKFNDPSITVNNDRLEALYEQRKDILKEKIKENQKGNKTDGICWYCHLPNTETLDHFLPKSDFPELAIYPNNLLLCCSLCNSIKKEYYRDENQLWYINPYYIDIDCITFLSCNIQLNGTQRIYEYTVNDSVLSTVPYGDEIKKQYEKLGLCNKYKYLTEGLITELIESYVTNPDSNIKNFPNCLILKKKSEQNKYGPNYWKCACYDAIYKNAQFIKILQDEIKVEIKKLNATP